MQSKIIAEQIFPVIQKSKQLEHKIKVIKEQMKNLMGEEDKRIEFQAQDVVVKYMTNRKYETNISELQDLLIAYGLLVPTANVSTDHKQTLAQIEEFKNKDTYHIRINVKVELEEHDFTKMNMEQLANEWFEASEEMKKCDSIITGAKKQMMRCEALIKNMKVAFEYGSITLVKNKVSYDIEKIYEKFGMDFVKKYTTPSFEKISKFVNQGFIEEKEVNQFKKVVDVSLKFVMMKLSDEEIVYGIMNEKNYNASLNKIYA